MIPQKRDSLLNRERHRPCGPVPGVERARVMMLRAVSAYQDAEDDPRVSADKLPTDLTSMAHSPPISTRHDKVHSASFGRMRPG